MTNFITPEGLGKFKQEYQERLERRKKLGKAVKTAKEHGDLSENADYAAAKAQQGENERRLNWLRCVIEKAEVVKKKGMDKVELGCLVELAKQGKKNNALKVRLVGTHEVNPAQGKISHVSPLGKAVLGKKNGEEIEVETQNGKEKYKIKKIN